MIRFLEWLAGWALMSAARMRMRRYGPDDLHEANHILWALRSGDTSGCTTECPLRTQPPSKWKKEVP